MKASAVLLVDAAINLVVGIILIFYRSLVQILGIPQASTSFYANMLGAVLFGIGIALLVECLRKPGRMAGLGLGGAISINLSGGVALILWLIFGNLNIPVHGLIILWALAVIVIGISIIEWIIHSTKRAS